MPQMNPFNWLMLLILFNFAYMSCMVKLHFFNILPITGKVATEEASQNLFSVKI